MPEDYAKCEAEGGRIRTMILGKNKDKTAHVCYDKAGKSHMGEFKPRKKAEKK